MFDGQIAPSPTPYPGQITPRDQACTDPPATPADGIGAEGESSVSALDLSPRLCFSCGVSVARFEHFCSWCRDA